MVLAWASLRGFLQKCGEPVKAEQIGQINRLTEAVAALTENYDKMDRMDAAGQRLFRQHLAFTQFVPGGKAVRAHKAVMDLTEAHFFDDPEIWDAGQVAEIIRPNVRFHNVKAGHFVDNITMMDADWCKRYLFTGSTSPGAIDLAYWQLIEHALGFGYKAAAHLLRNIGLFTYAHARPIIDVHIHKLLGACHMAHANYPEAGHSFYVLSELKGLPIIMLDAYAWCAYSGNWETESVDFGNFSQ